MKTLFDFIPQTFDHYETSKYKNVLLSYVRNTPNFAIQLL